MNAPPTDRKKGRSRNILKSTSFIYFAKVEKSPRGATIMLSSRLSPALPGLGRVPGPLQWNQVRGRKQKFGGSTRDPFKSLQRKLGREQQRKHAKVPLMSEERAQIRRLAPITTTSLGPWCIKTSLVYSGELLLYRTIGCYLRSIGKVCKRSILH